jgi:hypothetical protein
MRLLARIFGVLSIAGGVFALIPAVILLNQRLHLVHVEWGIFDVQAGGVAVSDAVAETVCGSSGIASLVVGVLLVRLPRECAA